MVFPSDSMAATDGFRKDAVAGEPTLVYRSKRRWGRTDTAVDGRRQEQGQKQLQERKGKQVPVEKQEGKAVEPKEEAMEDLVPEETAKAEVKPKFKHSRKQSHARPAASDRVVETRPERRPEPKVEPKVEVKEDPPSDTESEEEVQKTRRKRRKLQQQQQQKGRKDSKVKSEDGSEEDMAKLEHGDEENHEDEDDDDARRCKRSDGKSWRCSRPLYRDGWCTYHFEYYEAKRLKQPLPPPPKRQKKTKVQRTKRSREVAGLEDDVDMVAAKKRVIAVAAPEQKGRAGKGQKRKATTEAVAARGTRSSPTERASKLLKVRNDSGVDNVEDSDEKMSSRSRSSDSDGAEPSVDGKAGAGASKRKVCHPRRCHQCWRLGTVIACGTCVNDRVHRRYCIPCIDKWYPNLKRSDVQEKCPHCRGFCNCKTCLRKARPLVEDKQTGKVEHLHYLLRKLLPSLIHLHEEQHEELNVERELRGDPAYEVETTPMSVQERMYCNRCKTSIVDYYRTCTECDYDLCLFCCREMRQQRKEKDEATERDVSSTLVLDLSPRDASSPSAEKEPPSDGSCLPTPPQLPPGATWCPSPSHVVSAEGASTPVVEQVFTQSVQEAADKGDAGSFKCPEERDDCPSGITDTGVAAPAAVLEEGDAVPLVDLKKRDAYGSEEGDAVPPVALEEGDACRSAVTEEGEAGAAVDSEEGNLGSMGGFLGAEGDESISPAAAAKEEEDVDPAAVVDEDMAVSAAAVKEEEDAGPPAAMEEDNDVSAAGPKEKDAEPAGAMEGDNDVSAAAPKEEEDDGPAAAMEEDNDVSTAAPKEEEDASPATAMEDDTVVSAAAAKKREDVGPAAAADEENLVIAAVFEEQNARPSAPSEGVGGPESAMEEDAGPVTALETKDMDLLLATKAEAGDACALMEEADTGPLPSEVEGPRLSAKDGHAGPVASVQNEEPGFSSTIDMGFLLATKAEAGGACASMEEADTGPLPSEVSMEVDDTGPLPSEVEGPRLSAEDGAVPFAAREDGHAGPVASAENEEPGFSSTMDEGRSPSSGDTDIALIPVVKEDAGPLPAEEVDAVKEGAGPVTVWEGKAAPLAASQAGAATPSLDSDMSAPVETLNAQPRAQEQENAMDAGPLTASRGGSAFVSAEENGEMDPGPSAAMEGEESGASALEEENGHCLLAAKEGSAGTLAAREGDVGPSVPAGEGGEGELSNVDEMQEAALTYASPWEANADGAIVCAPKDWGGCGSGNLCLRSLQGPNTLKQVVTDVQRILSSTVENEEEDPSACMFCLPNSTSANSHLLLAAHRNAGGDNHLYCPNVQELENVESLMHFQQHWSRGQPVIVKNVNRMGTGLSWEPMVMWRAVREKSRKKKQQVDTLTVKAIECLSGCEVEIDIKEFFEKYEERRAVNNGRPPSDMYKLKDWPPSSSFSERLPRHHAEFLLCLPFKHYTHPEVGVLNLATKFPKEALRPDLGPKTYIAYGVREEMEAGNSVTKLHCDMSDAVNVLMHSKGSRTGKSPKPQGGAGEMVLKEPKTKQPSDLQTSGGALWDIFRREDVGKLQEYILKHWTEFFDSNKPEEGITHPVHDQLFYLNEEHKRRLKAELGIEAWTFEQHVGEAVFIPAGCPHQVRNLQSCIKVAMDFVSPENVEQCVKLTEEFRMLPNSHPSKEDKLEVRKMVFQAAKLAVQDLGRKPDEMPKKATVKGRTPEDTPKKTSSGSTKRRRKGVPQGAKPF